MMDNDPVFDALTAILAVTVNLDITMRKQGRWALLARLVDLGIPQEKRKALADMLVDLRRRDALLQDVVGGLRHELAFRDFEHRAHVFYNTLHAALPPSMTCNN